MRIQKICCLLFALLFIPTVKAQNKIRYPRYHDVVNYFFSTYSIHNLAEGQEFAFEKKLSGWAVSIFEGGDRNNVVKEVLIWNSSSRSYVSPDLLKITENEVNTDLKTQFMEAWEYLHFDACPYYNYRGWDWDVVREYSNLSDLPDTLLYGVGRAYSSVAQGFLNDNSGQTDLQQSFKLSLKFDALTKEQLEKYRLYGHKATEAFELLAKRNPTFKTVIGGIDIKRDNEYMTNYLNLIQVQNEEEALKEVPDGLYEGFYGELAKNYLNSCKKNAILFTYGDNDTYPLLYAQLKHHLRTDVNVINLSLLQTRSYQEFLRKGCSSSPAIALPLSKEELDDSRYELFIVIQDSIHEYNADALWAYAKNKKHDYVYNDVHYAQIPGPNLKWKFGKDVLHFTLSNSGYIYLSQFVELGIILKNLANRPIYFGEGLSNEYFLGLDYYVRLEGLVYKLQSRQNPNTADGTAYITDSIMSKHLMSTYLYNNLSKVVKSDDSQPTNYSYNYYYLANFFILEERKKEAEKVLQKWDSIFTNNILPYELNCRYFAELYYKLGQMEKGNSICRQIFENEKATSLEPSTLPYFADKKKERLKKVTEELDTLLEKYGQKEKFKDLW